MLSIKIDMLLVFQCVRPFLADFIDKADDVCSSTEL